MDLKKIIFIVIIICGIIIGAMIVANTHTQNNNSTQINNTTNITKNNNTNITNTTNTSSNDHTSNKESSSSDSDSESYVEKWDRSQRGDGNWAYTHDQPVKTDSQGNEYSRVYHEDTGKSSWEPTGPRKNK